ETAISICVWPAYLRVLYSVEAFIWINYGFQFLTIGIFGFFLTSFLPIGFEYGIEVTYPQSEVVCACILNTSTMIFGIILTEMLSHILESEGPLFATVSLITILFCAVFFK
ncbi:hypothetical protein CEXT_70431, partial [Caerostris extrusa]